MNSIVSQQPVMSTGTTNVGDFAELFNEIIGNDGTSEPSSSTDEMLDSFDLGITAAELFPADIFPALLDNNNADCGGPDAAMAELEDPDLGLVDSLFTPEQSDSDSGLGSGGLAAVNNNPTAGPTDAADPDHSCSRTRPATGIDYVVGVQSQASTTVAASSGAALVEGDQAKVKRIERMIKNRHSASESRRKRKEYLDGLERRVQSLASENAFLRDENSQLRQRYSELERKLISLEQALGSSASSGIGASSALTGSGRRRPVTAMALLLFLGLNLVGLGVWPLMPGQQQQQPQQPGFHSSPSSSSLFYYSNGPGSEESRALVPYRRASSAGRHLLSASSASSSEPAPEELSALF
uniref:BZIP domain-containing protein n=1 Tax=Macrostomum lignano TaxID=282301 RepID=A0A1I8GCP8_9PLAT